MNARIVLAGDCREVLARGPANSVDSVVTDPPYELNFMGKDWDNAGVSYDPETWKVIYRALKPGGHLLAFGATRTYHRIAVAIEDAGFEIRDTIAWMYGSGFPKSLDVSKAIDKAAGAERPVIGKNPRAAQQTGQRGTVALAGDRQANEFLTAPATPDAERWQGWGTALKPAFEPVIVARKPLVGTVAANVLEHGTGALNIDASRVGTESVESGRAGRGVTDSVCKDGLAPQFERSWSTGRWPANVILDPEAGAMLDEQSGERPGFSGGGTKGAGFRKSYVNGEAQKCHACTGTGTEGADPESIPSRCMRCNGTGREPTAWVDPGPQYFNDSGGASRFFYCAKASKRERNAGVDKNTHPTVKPLALMRYLVRLVTPPGGLVLDPFAGSGSTGAAAALEGFRFLGVELDPESVSLARARIEHWCSTVEDDEKEVDDARLSSGADVQPSLL